MSRKEQLDAREKHWYEGSGDARSMQRQYEQDQRDAGGLNPVRSKWSNPPPGDMMRPRSAQRLRDAQDRDETLNRTYASRPGSAPPMRQATPWQGSRKPGVSDASRGGGAWATPGPADAYGAYDEEPYGHYGAGAPIGEGDEEKDDYGAALDGAGKG